MLSCEISLYVSILQDKQTSPMFSRLRRNKEKPSWLICKNSSSSGRKGKQGKMKSNHLLGMFYCQVGFHILPSVMHHRQVPLFLYLLFMQSTEDSSHFEVFLILRMCQKKKKRLSKFGRIFARDHCLWNPASNWPSKGFDATMDYSKAVVGSAHPPDISAHAQKILHMRRSAVRERSTTRTLTVLNQ